MPTSRVAAVCAAALAASLPLSPPVGAQSKIEPAIEKDLAERGRARVVVKLRPDPDARGGGPAIANPAGYMRALDHGVEHVRPIGSLAAVSAEIDGRALARLREDPNVALVTRDLPTPLALVDSVGAVGAPHAHAAGFRGEGLSVAVLDTGVHRAHPAFAQAVVAEACFSTAESSLYKLRSLCPEGLSVSLLAGASRGCPEEVSGCDHGSHVAGIVAGRGMHHETRDFAGVAPGAGIVAVQVFTLFEDPSVCGFAGRCILSFTSDQLRALDWVFKARERHRIAAINMSLGGGYHDKACDAQSALSEIIERLRSKGVATVAAAGNDGFYDGISEPACVSHAVAVAATTKAGQLDVRYTNMAPLVALAAPGTDILSALGSDTYRRLTGTSMAAPHVAAAFALLRQAHPRASVTTLLGKLKAAGAPLADPRTGTRVAALALTPGLLAPDGQVVATAGSEAPARVMRIGAPAQAGDPAPAGDTGSWIVLSPRSAAEIERMVREEYPGWSCSVRQIGNGTYRVDALPKVEQGRLKRLERWMLEKVFRGHGDTRIFDNRLSVPKPLPPR